MRTEPNTSSGREIESELGAGEGKLLGMWWLLERLVREKEKEEKAIRAGKWDPESTVQHGLSQLLSYSVLPVAKECYGTRHLSHTETTSLHIRLNMSSERCCSRCLAWVTVTRFSRD